ncbi:SRPBCC family protein [Nitrosovibrio sp. Nv4]|uniref:SRPBCC family protein n=1 Tax=Nitrosovibrio sp. Nv4 TaxID=1945880 RepID=UPI000BDA1C10|nr:SRPBCC family protein [Nitrosovibrio sp. Nv4]SOD41421.1 Polyketide cyclase / dehydrase and lipid transport [Nitrosovibrio sp. Nv4]
MFNLGSMFNLGPSEPVVGKANILMECSAIKVFKYIGEDLFANYPKWSPEVKELEQLGDGPVKLGTIARQVRVDQGHRSESKFRITIYEPYKRLAFAGLSEPFRCIYELQDDRDGKSVKLQFTFELLEIQVFMRPFEPLVRTAVQDGAERTVRNIKRLIESEGAAPS